MAASGGNAPSTERTFSAVCMRCDAQLRIVDDLPATADVMQAFRGTVGDESFVVVPLSDPDEFTEHKNGEVAAKPSGGHELRVAPLDEILRIEKIMALASGQSEQDHPVCASCLTTAIAEVERQVEQAAEERRIYEEARDRLAAELRGRDGGEAAAIEAEIAELEAEESRLLAMLESFDREEEELKEELDRHRQQDEQLQREEEELWLSVAEYQLNMEESEEERAATTSAIQYATAELSRLRHTNVLNDMFHIAWQGPFGTINKFRIGRLSDQVVPWEEINAALGQACLLLDTLVRKSGAPTQYRLLPRGNYSQIQKDDEILKLHRGEGGLAGFFTDKKFDNAMSAFLACLKDVTRFLQRDPPFKIDGNKVGGFSICMQFNQDDRWTLALKFMLTDLKWIVPFVTSRELGDG